MLKTHRLVVPAAALTLMVSGCDSRTPTSNGTVRPVSAIEAVTDSTDANRSASTLPGVTPPTTTPACEPVGLPPDADVLFDYTTPIRLETNVGVPLSIQLAPFLDLPEGSNQPCITLRERSDVPEGTNLGRFAVDGTTLTYTPPSEPRDDAPWWGATSTTYCVDGLEATLRHCNQISIAVYPEPITEFARQYVPGGLVGDEALPALVLLDDAIREAMLIAGTSPAGVATVQTAWYSLWAKLLLSGLNDPIENVAISTACGAIGGSATGGAITEAYSLAFEAMELLLEGFDVALVEIDALAGIEPPAELRDRVNVGWVTLEIGLLYRDGLDALEKSFGTNLDDVMLTPAGRFALAEVCDLAASIPVPPPPIR